MLSRPASPRGHLEVVNTTGSPPTVEHLVGMSVMAVIASRMQQNCVADVQNRFPKIPGFFWSFSSFHWPFLLSIGPTHVSAIYTGRRKVLLAGSLASSGCSTGDFYALNAYRDGKQISGPNITVRRRNRFCTSASSAASCWRSRP